MKKKVNITIDGKSISATPDDNIVEVAKANGVYIPTLCFYPDMGKCLGTCRVCTVKWKRHHVAACTLKVEEGMELTVQSDELKDLRKALVELLFVEGNHFCPGCEKSGDCKLQALGYELQMTVPRFHYRFNNRIIEYNSKKILFEHNRCILCKRCTHKFKDSKGRRVFFFKGKGCHLEVEMVTELVDQLNEEQVDHLVELCPVGALLKKGKGFDRPYGERKYDKTPVGQTTETHPKPSTKKHKGLL
ncbi:MAG: 2Fe-2S iron-sulfur cluster binding domain-containing protein [Bdellovibrionaceae bacterium]|jgi:[NiFe] hydrogenase diaphorase moiety small subunit|nr:2Fe-2S iron-sulfur cluster binding domain-containing protein [Pseudobdellovibrionaceae bacterium]